MSERVDDVVIVGGGDAGLLSALALRQMNPDVGVAVVDDFDRDVPRVGKSTFREIQSLLHGALEIDEQRFVSEVKPVWKATVHFRDWCGYDSFHYPFDPATKFPGPHESDTYERYYHWYDERYADPDHRSIGEEIAAQGKSPWHFDPQQNGYEKYDATAYHLSTNRFNSFLRDLCRERDVSLIDDEIVRIDVSGDRIDRVRSKSQSYEADLYVDATGFNRVLRGEQDASFTEFDLPLDSAFNARVDLPLSEVDPATVIDTGEYGWFWQIDTYDNRDLGYVYASEFVSEEEARAEFVEHCGDSVSADDVDEYEFDAGFYDPALQENCVVMGNAQGFVEPLQSTALTTHAKAAVKLASILSAHGRILDDHVRDVFNAWTTETWNSIYDFISVHYAYASGDNEFWRAAQDVELSPRVEVLIDQFDRAGLDRNVDPSTTHPEFSEFEIFHPMAFAIVMRNMGAESTFYEEHPVEVSEEFREWKAQIDQATTEHVEGFLTTEEMYRGVVDSW